MSEKRSERIRNFLQVHSDTDKGIYYSIIVLSLFSLVMVASASISNASSTWYIVKTIIKNIGYLFIFGLFYFVTMNEYETVTVRKNIYVLSVIGIIALVAAYFTTRAFYGSAGINGAYAWLMISANSITVQPSEFIKPLMIAMNAVLLADRSFNRLTPFGIIVGPLILFVTYCCIIALLQHDLGTVFIIAAISTVCFLIPSHKKLKKYQIIDACLIAFVCVIFVLLLNEDVLLAVQRLEIPFLEVTLNRFRSALDPTFDTTGISREIYNSLYSIASGGLWGVGLGNSIQKYGYINATESDYIFAITVEELGIIGILLIFVPYIIILVELLRYAFKVDKDADRTILVGTAVYMFVHMFLNIGGVTGLVPLTGIPLLLVSSGGSAQLAVAIALGMSQRVISDYKYNERENILR